MFWLLRMEAFPGYFTRTIDGYRALLSRDVIVRQTWQKITVKGQPVGYGYTNLEMNEDNPVETYTVHSRLHLRLTVMGQRQNFFANTVASLDALQTLQRFTFSLNTKEYTFQLRADRTGARTFKTKMTTGHSSQQGEIEVPPDTVIYSPMTDLAIRNLSPGETMSLRILDPLTLATETVVVRAIEHEPVFALGRTNTALRIALQYRGRDFHSWIAPDGQVLKQETPFGWTIEACTSKEALAALDLANSGSDLLASMAVPVDKPIPNPRGATTLKLRLLNVPFSREELDTPRQSTHLIDGTRTEITLRSSVLPPNPPDSIDITEALKPSLAPARTIQSTHPDIIAASKKIVQGCKTPVEKALAISKWVHDNLDKENRINIPSALDVLKTRAGDCNEHTYLYVALARAAGLPSQVVVGVVYHEGAFYYHAWPSVYVGEWIETDPTWGQTVVDATHLALVRGDLADQVQLVKVMGQLRVEVMEVQH